MPNFEHRPQKKYGQNFLIDKNILQKIVTAGEVSGTDTVLEIGMGKGILTEALAQKAGKVITIEIDTQLFPETQSKLAKHENIDFILGDFLKKADEIFAGLSGNVKIIANIPYYITTPILEKLFDYSEKISLIVLLVQKEVADRMRAKPNTKAYGSLTLYMNYHAEVYKIADVSPNCFRPKPTVYSSIVKLIIPEKKKYAEAIEERLFKIIHAAFWGRRKTLANCLKMSEYTKFSKEDLIRLEQETGIDLARRGETLTLAEYVKLADIKI